MSGLYDEDQTEPVLDNLDADTKAMKELKAKLEAIKATANDSDRQIVHNLILSDAGSRRIAITPAAAAIVVLDHNPRNRRLTMRKIERLQAAIEAGDWRGQHHQGAAFDSDGHLGDAQHRMIACALSGKEITMLVTADVPFDDVLDVVDQTTTRTPGQALAMRGMARGEDIAPLAERLAVYLHLREFGTKPFMSSLDVQRYARRKQAMLAMAIDIGENVMKNVTDPPMTRKDAAAVAALLLEDGWDAKKATAFLTAVQHNIAPYEQAPTSTLGRLFWKARNANASKDKLSPVKKLAIAVKGAAAFDRHEGVGRLNWSDKEGYPTARPPMDEAAE